MYFLRQAAFERKQGISSVDLICRELLAEEETNGQSKRQRRRKKKGGKLASEGDQVQFDSGAGGDGGDKENCSNEVSN